MKQQQFRGLGFILVIMMMLLMITTFSGQIFTNDDISYQEYLTALADGSVEQVIINQNQQTPTGEVNLFLKDGSAKQYYTSDVIEEQHRLQELGIDYTTTDVPRENMVLTILLPIVISTIAVVILISVMNARSSGGGANARMMNFGRSRARLSRDSKVNFTNVAGLEEEKEELRPSGNRKNPSGQGGSRGGRSSLLFDFRFGFCGDVCRRRRFPCPGFV